MVRFLALIALLCAGLAVAGPAAAEKGMVNAVAFRPIPAGSAVAVEPLDNSDVNIALQGEFERILRQRGYRVAADANLVLTFETRELAGSWKGGGLNSWLEFSNNEDHTGTEAPQVRLRLLETNRGGLLNRDRASGGTRQVAPSQYRIDVSIDDRSDGKRLWQAWSTAAQGAADNLARTRAMVPVLVEALGKTVRRRAFELP